MSTLSWPSRRFLEASRHCVSFLQALRNLAIPWNHDMKMVQPEDKLEAPCKRTPLPWSYQRGLFQGCQARLPSVTSTSLIPSSSPQPGTGWAPPDRILFKNQKIEKLVRPKEQKVGDLDYLISIWAFISSRLLPLQPSPYRTVHCSVLLWHFCKRRKEYKRHWRRPDIHEKIFNNLSQPILSPMFRQ